MIVKMFPRFFNCFYIYIYIYIYMYVCVCVCVYITKQELDIILTCRKSVLVYDTTTWESKTTDNFNVTMG